MLFAQNFCFSTCAICVGRRMALIQEAEAGSIMQHAGISGNEIVFDIDSVARVENTGAGVKSLVVVVVRFVSSPSSS